MNKSSRIEDNGGDNIKRHLQTFARLPYLFCRHAVGMHSRHRSTAAGSSQVHGYRPSDDDGKERDTDDENGMEVARQVQYGRLPFRVRIPTTTGTRHGGILADIFKFPSTFLPVAAHGRPFSSL